MHEGWKVKYQVTPLHMQLAQYGNAWSVTVGSILAFVFEGGVIYSDSVSVFHSQKPSTLPNVWPVCL